MCPPPPPTLDAENGDSGDVDLDSPPVENVEEESAGSEDDSLEAEFDQRLPLMFKFPECRKFPFPL